MKKPPTAYMPTLYEHPLATFESPILTNRKRKHWGQHDVEVPFAKMITNVISTPPWKRRNGNTYACRLLEMNSLKEGPV
jgi:hypothetical protein